MAVITRTYPGRTDGEIYSKVDEVMEGIARRYSLDYRKDHETRTGSVSMMGASGKYAVRESQVTVELKFSFVIPGAMRKRVEGDVERKLDRLFGDGI